MNNFNIKYFLSFLSSVSISLLSLMIFSLISCNKDIIEASGEWTEQAPAKLDENAGNWKPCVLISADDIKIPDALATTTSQYQQELQEVKGAQANMTSTQKAAIKYWSAGVTLRWNEIIRA